ncbi:trace amine-associated receptor 1-like [Solea solea]|uniref:trace amine-associated receptor 1-like n=1 Tax=Solea solea TaxID=90069 RepID=UPI00272D4173|nr:trace amine-associated receptor 1-like [Solea solea]
MGPYVETMVTYTVLSCIIVLTVILNLLVIISISHFRQLHTTTNLLLLSLAVADFLVGLLQMPLVLLQNQGCWFLGDIMCVVHYFFAALLVNVSVGCMVLISVDRYIAICNPMFYTTRVTLTRARAMRSHVAVITVERSQTVKAMKSEIKAARTLGIVIIVFLLCSCPYYCIAAAAETTSLGASSSIIIMIWLIYLNSTFNPVIYVFFYPWVRKTIKHIFTLQILQPGSRELSVM